MYEYKEIYRLDFTNVKYYRQMHEVIQKELDFPDYYGCNWDAFWDCMTDMVGCDPIHIQIVGLEVLRQKKYDDVIEKLITLLRDSKYYYDKKYADEILIEIIDENGNITVVE